MPIRLRPPIPSDTAILFEQQLYPESNRLAVTNPRDAEGFKSAWEKNSADPAITARVILDGDLIVGSVSCFKLDGLDYVGYWIARSHWNRGIATRALSLLLEEVATRPLHARAARSNAPSLRVLEKCGFTITGYQHSPATPRFPACEEALLILNESSRGVST